MRLLLLGYFDLGCSIGVDDTALADPARLRQFHERVRLPVSFPAGAGDDHGRRSPIGVSPMLGAGLRVDLSGSPMLRVWQAEALQGSAPGEAASLESGEVRCYLDLNALGVGFIRCDVQLPTAPAADVIEIYRALERAAYRSFSGQLRELGLIFLDVFAGGSTLQPISRRRELAAVADQDVIPGFQALVLQQVGDPRAMLAELTAYEQPGQLQRLALDDGVLHLGWASALLEPTEDAERILFLLQLAHTHFAVVESFEALFSRRMIESVRESVGVEAATLDPADLGRLRALGHAVVELTQLNSVTINLSDLHLIDAFERLARLEPRRQRIRAACELFVQQQNERTRLIQERRQERLNAFLFFLTALTFVSVVADIINTVDYLPRYLPDPWLRLAVLTLPPLALIYVIRRLVAGGRRAQPEPGMRPQ